METRLAPSTEHLPLNVTPVQENPFVALPILAICPVIFHVMAAMSSDPIGVGTWISIFIFDALCVLIGCSIVHHDRLMRGKGVTVSEGGLSPSLNGDRLWTLPWSRIGELRLARPTFFNRFDPRNNGVDVIDTQGILQFRIPFTSYVSSDRRYENRSVMMAQQSVFWNEVRRRVPAGVSVETSVSEKPKVPTLRNVTDRFLIGLAATGGGYYWLCQSLVGLREWPNASGFPALAGTMSGVLLGMTVAGTGLGCLAAAASGYHYRLHPNKYDVPTTLDPSEGPRADEHIARYGKTLPILQIEEGIRYRTIDAEAKFARSQRAGKETLTLLRVMAGMYALVSLCLVVKAAMSGFDLYAYLTPLLTVLVAIGLGVWARFGSSWRIKHDDTVVRVGDDLLIVGPDGKHFSFPISQLSDEKTARRRLNSYGYTDALRNGKQTYRLNRAHLFASEIPLDHEELLQNPTSDTPE